MHNSRSVFRSRKPRALACGASLIISLSFFSITQAEEISALNSSPLEVSTIGASIQDKLSQKIDLDYKDADLTSVLRSISWTYNINIVTSPEVKGKVTISLKDVTVAKALEAILTINGLAYAIRDEIIYITVGDTKAVELISEVIYLKYISSAEAQNILRRIISDRGDIKIDELSNSLIITDFSTTILKVKELLKKVDLPPRQVLIEAKILDITSSDLAALGVKYDVDYAPGHGIFDRVTHFPERMKGTIDLAEQSSSLPGGQFTLNALTLKGFSATATIDALVKDGKASLLASPSIAVLNGQEARIVIGERYPYKERTQTTTGTTETTKFVDIGTTLRVSPQINEDGYITMRIHPEVSSLNSSLDAGPRITTREADTTVRIKEGETLVIGGLIKHKEEGTKEKIPILGDIPILGLLFSRSERDKEQKELAVFVTPKILRPQQEKETLTRREIEKEEALVNLEKTAQLSLVEAIFDKARALDKGYGLESARKDRVFRESQALNLYEHIYIEFPKSPRAPEALYSAAIIYYKYFKDYKSAMERLSRLISDYPESPFGQQAKGLYKSIEKLKNQ